MVRLIIEKVKKSEAFDREEDIDFSKSVCRFWAIHSLLDQSMSPGDVVEANVIKSGTVTIRGGGGNVPTLWFAPRLPPTFKLKNL